MSEGKEIKLHKDNLAVVKAAAKESYRLQCVRVEPDATVATDGHIMAVIGMPLVYDENTQGTKLQSFKPFNLALDSAVQADKCASANQPELTLNGDGLLRGDKGVAERKESDGQFPNWRAVMPMSKGFQIAFNPELMKRLCEVFVKVGANKGKNSVVMTFHESKETYKDGTPKENPADYAIRLDGTTASGLPVTAVLMPVRAELGAPLKDWSEPVPVAAAAAAEVTK